VCGLAGVIESSGTKRREELCTVIRDMSDSLRHRGPDDAGAWVDEAAGVGLAFRRLAIVDLSDAGHQPQLSHNGRFVLIFNGEIYNHQALREELAAGGSGEKWAGHSDTETLLAGFAAWGV
jgi:asparagine synthase (glutamine-hydrolysing)